MNGLRVNVNGVKTVVSDNISWTILDSFKVSMADGNGSKTYQLTDGREIVASFMPFGSPSRVIGSQGEFELLTDVNSQTVSWSWLWKPEERYWIGYWEWQSAVWGYVSHPDTLQTVSHPDKYQTVSYPDTYEYNYSSNSPGYEWVSHPDTFERVPQPDTYEWVSNPDTYEKISDGYFEWRFAKSALGGINDSSSWPFVDAIIYVMAR